MADHFVPRQAPASAECPSRETLTSPCYQLRQDIYEFIQRRSDWKKIEKTVDKTMYNLSFKEDCVIC